MPQFYILNEELLQDLSSRVSGDWYNLGLYLNLETSALDQLQERTNVPIADKPFRMLKRWRELRSPRDMEVPVLCHALAKIRRNDLVDFVRENFGETDRMTDTYLKNLSEQIVREWYSMGIYLGIPSPELTIIDESVVPRSTQPPAFEMLIQWRESFRFGEGKAITALSGALRSIRRNDVLHFLETSVRDIDLSRRTEGLLPSEDPYHDIHPQSTEPDDQAVELQKQLYEDAQKKLNQKIPDHSQQETLIPPHDSTTETGSSGDGTVVHSFPTLPSTGLSEITSVSHSMPFYPDNMQPSASDSYGPDMDVEMPGAQVVTSGSSYEDSFQQKK